MRLVLRHPYGLAADRFWSEMFFDPAYNRALYTEGLGFESIDVLEDVADATGRRTRRLRVRPRLDMPAAVRRLVGDAVSYVEAGTFDPAAGTFTTRILPSALSDRIRIETVMRCEPRGPDRCERVAEIDLAVRVLGVGRVFEKFLERTLRENYDKAAAFTERWLATQGK